MDGIDLVLEDDALEAVVDDAIELHTGARGLRSILEQSMLTLMFEAPDTHAGTVCRITAGDHHATARRRSSRSARRRRSDLEDGFAGKREEVRKRRGSSSCALEVGSTAEVMGDLGGPP